MLFCYASISKLMDFENFQVQIAQSPLLSAYAGFVSYSTVISEIIIVLLLLIPKSRLVGLYASLGIMSAFTVYIYLILNYSDFVPCSCGGILEKMGWNDHLIFNIGCIVLALAGTIILQKENGTKSKNYLLLSAWIMLISSVIVIIIFQSSEHIIKKENNFTRRFLMHPVLEDKTIKLDSDQLYFAGISGNYLFLGNKQYPQTLSIIDTDFNAISKMRIIPDNLNYPFRNLQMKVKSPDYYFYDGTIPVIYRGKVGSPVAHTISLRDAYFSQMAVLDSAHFALRTQSRQNKSLTLAELNLKEKPKVRLYSNILEKQIDGVFDSDGKLIAIQNSKLFIYLYSYRNQFIIFNSKFEVQKRLNTIDTISKAHIKTIALSNGKHKLAAPPVKVNRNISANRNIVFIQSDLRGKYESVYSWNKGKVIDIYRSDHQEYIGSFYVYNKGNFIISDFMVTDQYFYAIVGNELTRYTYRQPLLKYFKTGEAEKLTKE